MALLWKMICNLGDPMSLRHPVINFLRQHSFVACESDSLIRDMAHLVFKWDMTKSFEWGGGLNHMSRPTGMWQQVLLSLQRTATHCDRLQHTETHCNTLQHAVLHCVTLQHTATHCNTLRHAATRCNTLQHTASHCLTLQRAATQFNTLLHTATRCNTLQHSATHCSTLQHTYTHFRSPPTGTWQRKGPSACSSVWCDTTSPYEWALGSIYVTWLIRMCDTNHSYASATSCVCVTWLIRWATHECVYTSVRVTWLIGISNATHSYASPHSSICVTWCIDERRMRAYTPVYASSLAWGGCMCQHWYGVAIVSRLDQIISLFCRVSSL